MSRLALAVRWLGPLSVLLTALFFDAVGVSVMMLVCLGVTVTWRARLPAVLEIVTDLTLLLAAWSSVFLLYERYAYWDVLIHFSATAVLAELAFRALQRWSRLSPAGAVSHVVVVSSLGAALALVWEYLEFAGYWFVDSRVQVGYPDTLADLAAGHAGAVVAGIVGTWARQSADPPGGRTAEDVGGSPPTAGATGTGGNPVTTGNRDTTEEPVPAEKPGAPDEPRTTDRPDTTETKD